MRLKGAGRRAPLRGASWYHRRSCGGGDRGDRDRETSRRRPLVEDPPHGRQRPRRRGVAPSKWWIHTDDEPMTPTERNTSNPSTDRLGGRIRSVPASTPDRAVLMVCDHPELRWHPRVSCHGMVQLPGDGHRPATRVADIPYRPQEDVRPRPELAVVGFPAEQQHPAAVPHVVDVALPGGRRLTGRALRLAVGSAPG